MLDGFIFAIRFLTRIPTPGRDAGYPDELAARAVPFYPAVGLIIGVLLCVAAWLLHGVAGMPQWLTAAVVVALWAGLTGALHLDGLADCADAWMAGGTREGRLRILKDTHNGSGAIVAVVLVLVIKTAGVAALLDAGGFMALALAPMAARAVMMASLTHFPYARDSGMGAGPGNNANVQQVRIALGVTGIVLVLYSVGALIASVLAAALTVVLVYHAIIRHIHGVTGDVHGAMVEIGEAAILAVLVVLI